MSDYSDIIFLMGAIIMFSFLTMSVNRTILMNEMNRVGHQTDYYALSVAQETIDEIRWIRSENALNQKLNEYPKAIEYRSDSDQTGSIPFMVDLFETTASIENDDIRTIELRIDVTSDFGVGGEGGNPVQLLFTKSFVK